MDLSHILEERMSIDRELALKLSKFENESESWKPIHQTDTMTVHLDTESSDVRLFSESILPIKSDRLAKYMRMQVEEDRPLWHKGLLKSDILHTYDGFSVHRLSEKPPWPYSPRDLVYVRSYHSLENKNGCVIMTKNVEDAPEIPGHVRAAILFGAITIQALSEDTDKCRMKLCFHRVNDMKIPKFVVAAKISEIISVDIDNWVSLAQQQ